MNRMKNNLILLIFVILLVMSCQNKTGGPQDTPTSGTVKIAVDETLAPIISSEIDVFESIYKTSGIISIVRPEVDAFNLLLKDSVRMIIAPRKLTSEERSWFESNKIIPKEVRIAVDAIAFVVNKKNPDTLMSVDQIRKILIGEIKSWNEINSGSKLGTIKVVFDHTQSSTAQYAVTQICKGQKLSPDLSAVSNNLAVIDLVSETANAIGIIGVNWISTHSDSASMGFLDQINVVAVSKEEIPTKSNSFQPYQAYLATGQYPFRRDIYAILADPRVGLTSGFTSFLTSDRGQRIILKSGILPVTQPIRLIQVKENL
ncbi:MAG: PstS family phosphate ABC transporter substrate-binding protein [Mangrovibacterium sp.]